MVFGELWHKELKLVTSLHRHRETSDQIVRLSPSSKVKSHKDQWTCTFVIWAFSHHSKNKSSHNLDWNKAEGYWRCSRIYVLFNWILQTLWKPFGRWKEQGPEQKFKTISRKKHNLEIEVNSNNENPEYEISLPTNCYPTLSSMYSLSNPHYRGVTLPHVSGSSAPSKVTPWSQTWVTYDR